MKIAVGSDHAGFELKNQIITFLKTHGYEIIDCGCFNLDSVDYPDYAAKVAHLVASSEAKYGILVCYTGIGMSIAANKVKGIRASLVGMVEDAVLTREHNDSNVLCLSAKNTNYDTAIAIVNQYLTTAFVGDRHLRRVNKIGEIENGSK